MNLFGIVNHKSLLKVNGRIVCELEERDRIDIDEMYKV
jgi:hypothetical protein